MPPPIAGPPVETPPFAGPPVTGPPITSPQLPVDIQQGHLAHTASKAQAQEEDDEVYALLNHIQVETQRLAAKFSKSQRYYQEQLYLEAKSDRKKRSKINTYNAFIYDMANKENEGTCPFACWNLTEV